MKNILLSTGIFPPETGGPATYIEGLGNWLHQKKYTVTVVTALKCGLEKRYPFRVELTKKKGRWLWHLNIFIRLFRLLKCNDVIYINGLFIESFLAAFLKRKKFGLRIAGDQVWERAIRNNWTKENFLDFQNSEGNIRIRFLRKIRKAILNCADIVIVPSLFLAGVIENWGVEKGKIEVIYNPYSHVDTEPFDIPAGVEKNFRLVTGGRLVSWKGIDMVIRAIKSIENCSLLVFGEGPEKNHLENLSTELSLKERVFFTGNLSRSQVAFLFSRSDCFALNSTYEGLPHVILEALAVGCPVVASEIGGIPEVIQHNHSGILFKADNISDLIRSIDKIKQDKKFGNHIAENGRQILGEKFDQDRLFGKVEKMLAAITRSRAV